MSTTAPEGLVSQAFSLADAYLYRPALRVYNKTASFIGTYNPFGSGNNSTETESTSLEERTVEKLEDSEKGWGVMSCLSAGAKAIFAIALSMLSYVLSFTIFRDSAIATLDACDTLANCYEGPPESVRRKKAEETT